MQTSMYAKQQTRVMLSSEQRCFFIFMSSTGSSTDDFFVKPQSFGRVPLMQPSSAYLGPLYRILILKGVS